MDRKLLTLCLLMCNASAFTVQNRPRLSPIIEYNKIKAYPHRLSQPTTVHHPIPHRTQTSLNSISATSSLFQSTSNIIPLARRILLPLLAITLFLFNRRIFYPNSSPDPSSSSHPLPPGKFGCPFFGNNMLSADEKTGPAKFWLSRSKSLGHPNVFKFYFLGRAMANVRGLNSIKQVLDREFTTVKTQSGLNENSRKIFGSQSLLMSHTKEEHSFLRKLVGMSMTPKSISKAMPALQQAANEQVDKILEEPRVTMSDVCTNFTLDIAWKQILGLNLKEEEEILTFRKTVQDWIYGLLSPAVMLGLPGLRFTRAYKAKKVLDKLIMEKIDELERNGPDGSTLSAMVFARDDEDNQKLTREQLLDNALLLILAGSETSAGTLTVAMLLLGLHPNVWQKIKEEQKVLVSNYGETLTKKQLDDECPYLEAFIKETMRIRPLTGGTMRISDETLVIDGKQIPKGWPINYNVRLTHELDPVTYQEDGSHMDIVKGFKPERWLSESTRPVDFMPFGYGSRYCLGVNLSMAEMKTFLAILARRVDFDLVGNKEDIKWKKMSIIPQPKDGVVIAPRNVEENAEKLLAV